MKRICILFALPVVLAGCGGPGNDSPYAEVLAQPLYRPLTDSIEREPQRSDLYFRRAVLLNQNNLPEPALADFQKAWSLSRQEIYALGAGNLLLEKDPAEAAGFLTDAVKQLPNSIPLQLTLARAYAAQNKTAEALAISRAILQKQPGQPHALQLQLDLVSQTNEPDSLLATLEQAHRLAPKDADISQKLAYQYAENKDPKALALADSLIAADREKLYAHPLYIKGMYYANTGDNASALRFFTETLQRDYNYLNAYIEKGKILLKQKKTTEALQVFALANRIDPAFADAWFWIGTCQEEAGRREEARLSYEKAYELDKTFTEAKEAAGKLR
ncbi:MAG: tetratricopeptide repeat protein [Chitinophagaceae bacterium]